MHTSSISVNKAFTPVRERPISWLCAIAVLCALGGVVHHSVEGMNLGGLGIALMIIFAALAVLQWLAQGRYEACKEAGEDELAAKVLRLSLIFGAGETFLYAFSGLGLLAERGYDVFNPIGWIVALFAGAATAYVNYNIKHGWCDALGGRKTSQGPTGGHRVHDALFSEPVRDLPALAAPESDNVVAFDLERAIRHKGEQERSLLGDIKAACAADGDAARRLQLATKRLQTRHRRATKRTTIAA